MQDDRVKPGMSVSATIIIEVKQDALLVPNSALKIAGDVHYVEILQNPPTETGGAAGVVSAAPPQQLQVEIGDSNDSSTEIMSGISDGEQIISRTVTAATKSTATAGQSLFPTGSKTSGATGAAAGGARTQFIGR
jgi:hypothetical protein